MIDGQRALLRAQTRPLSRCYQAKRHGIGRKRDIWQPRKFADGYAHYHRPKAPEVPRVTDHRARGVVSGELK